MALRTCLIVLLVALATAARAAPPPGATPAEQGLNLARAAEAADAGFGAFTATGEMVLSDAQGRSARRGFEVKKLEGTEDGDRTLIVFAWPPDIRDTALLTHAHDAGDDDQWLYLPALKRVKRIASRTRAGAFVGSEFAYEDLVPTEIEKFSYRYQGKQPCPGAPDLACHVNERTPRDAGSGYSRQVVWLDDVHYRLWKVDYYDRAGALRKTLTAQDYAVYRERFWRPARLLMRNVVSGKSTLMRWEAYDFGVQLGEQDFTTRALERVQ
jgi:hypothetical protein